jgi:hypothetical protein
MSENEITTIQELASLNIKLTISQTEDWCGTLKPTSFVNTGAFM